MKLSHRCTAIEPSVTMTIDAKAKKLKSEGQNVIGLGAGEPDFDTPEFIKAAAKEALDKGLTKYTPASGTADLKKAICKKLYTQNGLSYEPGEIVVANGAKHALFNAFAALLNPGDEVIIPVPYWVTYPELVKFNGGVPVFVNCLAEDGFVPQPAAIRAAVTKNTKVILMNSPSNPSGAVYSQEVIRQIAQIAVENDLFIVSDEIYEELIYQGSHFSVPAAGPGVKERTVLINGLSKAYAMTGWRIGYTAAPKAITAAMSSLQSHATSNPNTMAQYASVAALTGPRDQLEAMRAAFRQRRDFMCSRINQIQGLSCLVPSGAFYVMLNISEQIGRKLGDKKIWNSIGFCDLLLDEKLVAMVPGAAFGVDNYCRLSYATSMDSIKEALDRVEGFVKSLEDDA